MNKEIDRIQKNPFLDYFRGISALLVMLFHYTYLYGTLYGHLGDYPLIVNRGSFAVLMFFLLSGYLTFKGMPRYSPWAFVRSRFLRLYPTFWVCLIPTMILVTMYLPDRAVSMKDFLLNFTMIPMYLGADFVDGAYWTLSCDVFFYVLIVFTCLLRGGKYCAQIIIGWFILQLVLLGLPDMGLIALVKKINRFLFFHCFMAGGIVALLEKQWVAKKGELSSPMVVLLCVALVFFVLQQFIDHETDSGIFLAVSVVLLGISLIIYTKWGGGPPWLQKLLSPLVWFASISYPFYLLHQNIGYIIIKAMESVGMTSELYLILPISIIIVVAWLVHKHIEVPSIALASKKNRPQND